MYCPSCGYTYVEGMATCPDCRAKLLPGEPPNMPQYDPNVRLVTVARYFQRIDAELAKITLDGEGIECVLAGEVAVSVVRPETMETVRLMVREQDQERARIALNATTDPDSKEN